MMTVVINASRDEEEQQHGTQITRETLLLLIFSAPCQLVFELHYHEVEGLRSDYHRRVAAIKPLISLKIQVPQMLLVDVALLNHQ